VVCGGFVAPLNYADYCVIITDNGFDALFAANRITASIREKSRTHPNQKVLFSLLSDLYLNPIGGGGQKKKNQENLLGFTRI
jgi:hypothetical protein